MLLSEFIQTALKPHFRPSYSPPSQPYLYREDIPLTSVPSSIVQLYLSRKILFCEHKTAEMKYWHLWKRCSWNRCVPTKHFYFVMLGSPTDICLARGKNANSYTQKYSNATWQTTDVLNIIIIPHTYQQLATSCPSWNHSFTPDLEECNPSSTFRMA